MASITEPNHLIPDFFTRRGLTAHDVKVCFDLVYHQHPNCTLSSIPQQGACSYTLFLHLSEAAEKKIIQFRPNAHALDPNIAENATRVFANLAPTLIASEFVDLSHRVRMQVLEMTVVRGLRAADVLPPSRRRRRRNPSRLPPDTVGNLAHLLRDLADFFATSWHHHHHHSRREATDTEYPPPRLVGPSIPARLRLLARDLSTAAMRQFARRALRAVEAGRLAVLPVVLNHGDLLPANVLVDVRAPGRWRLAGVVDWAEAEFLPFGMSLGGVEHFLGRVVVGEGEGEKRKEEDTRKEEEKRKERFVYYVEADWLREIFWDRLRERISELSDDPEMWRAMLLSRAVGILLWHGIAWNDGKRDRAIDPDSDGADLAYLESFLSTWDVERKCEHVKL